LQKFNFGSQEWAGLSKLSEECGETVQVIGKLIATDGNSNHWDGSDLYDRIEEEIADVLAAAQFVIDYNGLDQKAITQRMNQKYALFSEWHKDTLSPVDDKFDYCDSESCDCDCKEQDGTHRQLFSYCFIAAAFVAAGISDWIGHAWAFVSLFFVAVISLMYYVFFIRKSNPWQLVD
jgi:NTP pyrophosphatase (non-canonical NTP hydrolase)